MTDDNESLRAELERLRLLADGHSACAAGLAEELATVRAELERVAGERDEARAALRSCALRCQRCDGVATRVVGVAGGGSSMHRRACDAPACVLGLSEHDTVSRDLPHAVALRALGGGR